MKKRDVIIACDFDCAQDLIQFLSPFWDNDLCPFVKIGMELFYSEGEDILHLLKDYSHNIFLDLKLHDIPTTVYKSLKVLNQLPVDLISVHVSGGLKMLNTAVQATNKCAVVTQLTSNEHLDTNIIEEILFNSTLSNVDYIICPINIASIVRNRGFKTICPGIRLENDDHNDQKQVCTPKQAREEGVDYIVVGRSITQAKDPADTYLQICKEFL